MRGRAFKWTIDNPMNNPRRAILVAIYGWAFGLGLSNKHGLVVRKTPNDTKDLSTAAGLHHVKAHHDILAEMTHQTERFSMPSHL